jgi:hypothetical protein
MSARFANGAVYNMEIPEGDYSVRLTLRNLRTDSAVERSVRIRAYFAYMNIQITQAELNEVYFAANLRGHSTATLKLEQKHDAQTLEAAYRETLLGLFNTFGKNITRVDSDWVKNAVSEGMEQEVKKQFGQVKELVKILR